MWLTSVSRTRAPFRLETRRACDRKAAGRLEALNPPGPQPTGVQLDRRAFLAAAAGSTLAGCLGGGPGTDGDGSEGGGGANAGETVESLPPPVQGDPDADVTVMVFADFACPHCASFEAEVLPQIESEYVEPGLIRYEHRDFPIPVDEQWSWAVAGAARSVQDAAGDDAFFGYAKACFSNQSSYSFDLLGQLAEEEDVDGERVVADAQAGTYRPALEADRALGRELDLQGTPQVYVNRQRLPRSDFETVSAAVEAVR